MLPLVWVATVGLISNLLITYFARRLAFQFGQVDRPDGRRKIHTRPVAVVGGIALFLSLLVALVSMRLVFANQLPEGWHDNTVRLAWLLSGGALILAVGAIDDRVNLRARVKVVGQIAAILLVVLGGGYRIEVVSLFGLSLPPFGIFAIPITVFWFLLVINAVNLLDGMDGMLGTLGIVIVASLGLMALKMVSQTTALVAFALVGGLIGFLWYNKPPASVYLGDAGSLFIGLIVAALSIQSALKGPTVAILAPLALLVLPLLDTGAAILRRKLTGRGIAVSDRGHLHHSLQKSGLSVSRSLLYVAALGVVAACGAVVSSVLGHDWIAIATSALVVGALLVLRLFGGAELKLLFNRLRTLFHSKLTRAPETDMQVVLQGTDTAQWDEVWKEITSKALDLALTGIHLDINAPAWHLGYHRRWETRNHSSGHLTGWHVDLPIVGHGQVLGRLAVFGKRADECIGDKLSELSELVRRAEILVAEAVQPSVVGSQDTVENSPRIPAVAQSA